MTLAQTADQATPWRSSDYRTILACREHIGACACAPVLVSSTSAARSWHRHARTPLSRKKRMQPGSTRRYMYSNCRVRGQDLLKLLLLAYDLTDPLHQALSSMAISYVRAHTLPAFKQRWGASTCVCKKRYIATMQGTRSGCSKREPKCVADRFYFEGTRGGLLAKAARSGQLDPKTAGSIAKTVHNTGTDRGWRAKAKASVASLCSFCTLSWNACSVRAPPQQARRVRQCSAKMGKQRVRGAGYGLAAIHLCGCHHHMHA